MPETVSGTQPYGSSGVFAGAFRPNFGVSETDIDKTYSVPKSHISYRKPRRLSDECREHKREQMTRYNSRDS